MELEDIVSGAAEEIGVAETGADASIATETRHLVRQKWAWAAVALVSTGVAALLAFLHSTEVDEPRPATHFVLDTPDDLSFGDFDFTAVSPDGRHVAFAGVSSGGSRRLWIGPLESPEARPLSGTESAVGPFWSPDGRSIAFSAGGT